MLQPGHAALPIGNEWSTLELWRTGQSVFSAAELRILWDSRRSACCLLNSVRSLGRSLGPLPATQHGKVGELGRFCACMRTHFPILVEAG